MKFLPENLHVYTTEKFSNTESICELQGLTSAHEDCMSFENDHRLFVRKEIVKDRDKKLGDETNECDVGDKKNPRDISDFLCLGLPNNTEVICPGDSKRLYPFSEDETDRKRKKFHNRDLCRGEDSKMKSILIETDSSTHKIRDNTSSLLANRSLGIFSDDLLKHFLIEYALSAMSDDKIESGDFYTIIQREANQFGRVIQRVCYFFLDALLARKQGNGFRRFRDPPAGKPQELEFAMNEVFRTIPNESYCVKSVTEIFTHALHQQKKVHIIQLGMNQNNQISQLMQSLASSNKDLSLFRYTSITNSDSFHKEYELRLAMLATRLGIEFDFHCMNLPLEQLTVPLLNLREGEAVAVCCCMELHHMMDESVFRYNQRDAVIHVLKGINARVVCLVEMNADFNGLFFLKRFKECLEYFHSVFEYHDALFTRENRSRLLIEKQIMGKTIMNVVACEGSNRRIRAESLEKWEKRMVKCGFSPLPVPRSLNQDLSVLLEHFPDGFSSKDLGNSVGLSWKERGIVFISAWQ